MSTIAFFRAYGPRLQGAEATFDAGLTVVLGAPADGTSEIAELCAGIVRPARGALRIDARDPWSAPDLRARIGVLLAEEPPSSERSIERAVRACLRLRGDSRDAGTLLGEHGLSGWAESRPDRAPATIRRHVALCLALTVPRPLGVVLCEPFAAGPLASREMTRAAILALAETEACVIVLTASPRDAAELGGRTVLLDRGRFARQPGLPLGMEMAPGALLGLRVRAPDARRLASGLGDQPAVEGLTWDGDQVVVRGKDTRALALAISDVSCHTGIEITAIEPILPSLDEARAATAGLWRASYEAALEAGRAHARARFEAGARARTLADLEAGTERREGQSSVTPAPTEPPKSEGQSS